MNINSIGDPICHQFQRKFINQLMKKMVNSLIVRLLGKTIGFKALLNHIKVLWVPVGEFCLINLDNGYRVRFALEDDYTSVLTGGSWMIYGSYLLVQLWS